MDLNQLIWNTIESQGLVVVTLSYMIYQSSKERAALLHKNCEMNHFMMDCLKQKLDEDSPLSRSTQIHSSEPRIDDLPSGDTTTPPDAKVEPWSSQRYT
jgi:hypothetical protein